MGKGSLRSICMLSWHSAPREAGEHVTRVVTKLTIELLVQPLAPWLNTLKPCQRLLPRGPSTINEYVKGGATGRPWNKNTGLWWEKGFRLSCLPQVLEGP